MPTIQYTDQIRGISITKSMNTPIKKFQDLIKGWYKEAQKVIPEIPTIPQQSKNYPVADVHGRYWKLQSDPDVSLDFIKYTLVNDLGEKAYLVIKRNGSAFDR